ncbi:putative hscarg dehydrogenase [Talaromyces proteolyticus]|uniref:Hscarg dehydrogenase n=1 Tax=Talaromyces proteolyticus TaxID=1131652 RepID=A0AAD4PV36_9EURO|nr:putative hscarg dehydrogenase [Talaromyces proteolyticus]KAH8690176.1 putative hscarg dehydrogenase [Talaromyces proteolyticus]
MSPSEIIAVIGATGSQGGSVVDALLEAGEFKVRAVLRNPTPEKAEPLRARGLSLIKAFEGVYGIYAVTDFIEPFMKYGPEEAEKIELVQATNLAQAAAATDSLSHYIWSTLPSSAKLSQGKYLTPHFESKAAVDEYILKELPDLAAKTTFFWISYYASNLTFPPFTPNLLRSSGQYGWIQPVDGSTPITTVGDERKNVGLFVKAILQNPKLTRGGKYVLAEVETLTNQQVLESWGRATGKPVTYIPTTLDAYDSLFPKWGREMGVMLEFWNAAGKDSWSKPGVTPLHKEDLGIDVVKLTGLETALGAIKWKGLT